MIRSELLTRLPGVVHGFGDRAEPFPKALEDDWEATRPRWKQVHGVAVATVASAGQECGEVDALTTRRAGQTIAVVSADCVPVLLARREGGAVAAVHAGWRGTRAGIVGKLWASLAAQGEVPADWIAAIGPAIGPCCYEVSEDLARDFGGAFRGLGCGLAVPRDRHLDLPAINAAELRAIGVGEVDLLRHCTKCERAADGTPRFMSYRRDGSGQREWSAIRWR